LSSELCAADFLVSVMLMVHIASLIVNHWNCAKFWSGVADQSHLQLSKLSITAANKLIDDVVVTRIDSW